MPNIFLPTYTKPIPPNAESVPETEPKQVRWRGRSGKWVYAAVIRNDRCRVEGETWWIRYVDAGGRVRSVKGFRDRLATESLASRLATNVDRERAGVPVESFEHEPKTLSQLLDDWEAYLAMENTAKYARSHVKRVRDVCARMRAARTRDLTPSSVRTAIHAMKVSASTRNHYVGACKQFTRWLFIQERVESSDLLAGLHRRSNETDRRVVRRVLNQAEFDRLIAAARSGRPVKHLTGRERAVLYLVAARTGLRAAELASLTRNSFSFDKIPCVSVKAAYSKNRRDDVIPLPPSIVTEVRAIVDKAAGRIWPHRGGGKKDYRAWWNNAAQMLRVDLKAAGIEFKVDGRVFDFHALRSQFATDLDRAGVSLARAQKLMRHCTPLLTSKYYTRPDLEELAAEVGKLSAPPPPTGDGQRSDGSEAVQGGSG